MIINGFAMTVKDIDEMHDFKESAAYGSYLKSIAGSPAFATVLNEHVNNVDIADDIKKLQNNGQLPNNVSAKALNELFKQSLSRMAMGIVADTVILKELEELKLQEVVQNIKDNSSITYLLGKADKKYYNQAAKLIDEGKIQEDSLAFKGLMVYMKNNGTLDKYSDDISPKEKVIKKTAPKSVPKIESSNNAKEIDFDSNNIDL